MNVFRNWLLVICGIALAVSGWQLFQAYRAIDAWQVEVERLNAEMGRLEVKTEGNFYWGVTASCTYIGSRMQVPREMIVVQCASLMKSAYEGDWYNKLRADSWVWPPKKE